MKFSFFKNRLFLTVLAGLLIGLFAVSRITGWIVDWLWMGHLGYGDIFLTLLSVKLGLFGVAFFVVFLVLSLTIRFVFRFGQKTGDAGNSVAHLPVGGGFEISRRWLVLISLAACAVTAIIFSRVISSQWDSYLRFYWGTSFGRADPIFGKDLGFYLFRLPFYELVQNSFAWLSACALAATLLMYGLLGAIGSEGQKIHQIRKPVVMHLSFLLVFFVFAWGCGYYLDRYEILLSPGGVVFGAGYTDVNVVLPALWIMTAASFLLMVATMVNMFARKSRVLYISIGVYLLLAVGAVLLLPNIIQKFFVQPNELRLEMPYLGNYMKFTREAYSLDRIREIEYPALTDLTPDEISANRDTLENVRLWDWRPILETFRQTQEIRLYYKFYEIDVDRYNLGEEGYRQVMLSARELAGELPEKARTWVNHYLQYTHGYGLVMSPVSEKAEEGFPVFVIKDLPPESPYLPVDIPAVYYGEKTPGYRIVNTKIKEFDYPMGDRNVYTNYKGKGGVFLTGFWKRLLFAWELSDINILISSYITPESRIQIRRRVAERVNAVAPFLMLDNDPYLVLSAGKLYWVQDAYTASSSYPYSEPYEKGLNYIRNSVKAVVDTYDGSVSFYVMDPGDPVLGVYRRAFPDAFRDLDELPSDLKGHLRYPEDLFAIQAEKFRTFHMTDPQVFYNREDLWTFPTEKYSGSAIRMEPYYILMRLPGQEKLQYLIMSPLTPENRDNMIAWLAGKSDFPEYGKMEVYKLPKEKLIYGPMQVEAMIDQDDVISQQLSLWDQRGSRVIRGNLLVLPLDHSFMYIEPVYLVAEGANIPQLKRVIAVYGESVVMEPTLSEAVQALFGAGEKETRGKAPLKVREEIVNLLKRHLRKAEDEIRKGNWSGFGEAMEQLKKILETEGGVTGQNE